MSGDGSVVVPGHKVRHYYHAYAASHRSRWIIREHMAALADSGIEWDLVVGIIGNRRQVELARAELPDDTRVHSWPDGFEQRTLNVLVDDLRDGFRGPVMYAHTKGAGYPVKVSAAWRECMTNRVVREAKICLDHLADGADTVGAHWMTPHQWPGKITVPMYGGNFWWATFEHLSKLGRPSNETRFHAEHWIGSVVPKRPVNLAPDWPGEICLIHK